MTRPRLARQGPFLTSAQRRYWRWAEPDNAFGVSGQPNNPARRIKGGITYGTTDEFGLRAVENKAHVHDLHPTILVFVR